MLIFPFAADSGPVNATHNPRLVISEVYPNALAKGTSTETNEWVEIHNPEHHAVSLKGWTIEDSQAIAPLPDFDLAAGATVLIVGSAADIVVPAGETLIQLDRPRLGSGLRNAGDRVALINPYGVRRDAMSWGDVRHPWNSDPPKPGQSIVRTHSGGQSRSDEPTPWAVGEAGSTDPQRYGHSRPDTQVRITEALIAPTNDEPESLTISNVSNEPILTVNWVLSAGSVLVQLPSWRIEPHESHTFAGANGRLGTGLRAAGGHLVLRDPKGNWLATASWGDDETFHRLPAAAPGQKTRFSSMARVHPQIPWFETIDDYRATTAQAITTGKALTYANTTARTVAERRSSPASQQAAGQGVWISEVYPNAGQGRADPEFEWFELTNSTDQEINLSGWTIADNTSSDPLDSVIIPADESIVLGVSSQVGLAVIEAITDGRIGNGLANTGDQLRLIDPEAQTVSAISWGSDRAFTTVQAPDADESIHRPSPNAAPRIGRPSPGALTNPAARQNVEAAEERPDTEASGAAGESAPPPASSSLLNERQTLQITEILPAPLPGQPEWVELHNPGDQPIDLDGWAIGDAAGQTEISGTIAPRSRLVIATAELAIDTPLLLVERIGNGLNNDGDTLTIYNADGLVVGQVRYGSEALPAPERGRSIALEPQRWIVTARPTPGKEDVTPLLDDSFRQASTREPVSDEGRLPIVAPASEGGSDAWMIVSFALIGVIVTLVVRRWRPHDSEPEATAPATSYTGPSADLPPSEEPQTGDEQSGQ